MESGDITRRPLRTKLLITFAVIFTMTAGIGWLGVAGMYRSWNRMSDVFDITFQVNLHISQANVSLFQWNRAILHRILSADPAEAAAQEANIELYERKTFGHLEAIAEGSSTRRLTERATQVLEAFGRAIPLKERALVVIGESRRGDAYDFVVEELRPRVDELIGMMDDLLEIKRQEVAALAGETDAQMRRDVAMIAALLLAALAVYGVMAYGMSSTILSSMGELVRGARSVAKGDFPGARVDLPAGDEFGYVAQAFNGMLASVERSLAEEKAAAAELARHRDHLEEIVSARTEELSSQWSRLLDILRSFPEMVYVIDPDTHEILFANISMEDKLGPVVGRKCHEALMGCLRPCSFCSDIRQLKGVETRSWETRLPVIGRYMAVTDQRVRWIDGREVRLELAVDITERKMAEKRLRESEERFRTLFDRSRDAMMTLAPPDWHFASGNPAALRLFGLSSEAELLATRPWDLSPETQPDGASSARKAQEIIDATILEGSQYFEWTHRRAGGEVFPATVMMTKNEMAGRMLLQATVRDITAEKRAEAQLQSALVELERSNRELEQFAYMASHDLQEPLRMVSSYTQLLARRYKGRLDKDADDFIHFAVDGAERMQRLINDLLAYSRVSTRGREPEPVDAGEALEAAKANLQAAITESHAVVEAGDLPTVRFDPTQLVQVFQNLIGNAIKFSKEGEPPRVNIMAEGRPGGWLFSVRDNGIGIAPEYQEKVFAIFQRLHGRGRYPGTGIGLALCRRIIERRGGRIWVESTEGQGSTFHFTVPETEGA